MNIQKHFFLSLILVLFSFPLSGQGTLEDCELKRFNVFLDDPDPTGTNIRRTPGGEIVAVIKNDPSDEVELYHQFRVCRMVGNWMLVETTYSPTYVSGWIHNSVVSVIIRAYSKQIPIYWSADLTSEEVYRVPLDRKARILAVNNKFAKITCMDDDGHEVTGFIEVKFLCGNPYTTCG